MRQPSIASILLSRLSIRVRYVTTIETARSSRTSSKVCRIGAATTVCFRAPVFRRQCAGLCLAVCLVNLCRALFGSGVWPFGRSGAVLSCSWSRFENLYQKKPTHPGPRSDVPVSGVLRVKSFGAVQSAECAAKRAGESEISPW